MAQFHFVEDYEKHVDALLAAYPLDQAMQLAIGGHFEEFGAREVDIVRAAGLSAGMTLVDLGCGSGRLSSALGRSDIEINYVGIDVIQRLLDYAATISPSHYRFINSQALVIPVETASVDVICAFSLFTHLLHHETFLYLQDGMRVLRPGGRIVFSFLEFAVPEHWETFNASVVQAQAGVLPHLNAFIERGAIEVWAERLGLRVLSFDPPQLGTGVSQLGQSIVVLEKAA